MTWHVDVTKDDLRDFPNANLHLQTQFLISTQFITKIKWLTKMIN